MFIEPNTQYKIRLYTNNGQEEALSNMLGSGSSEWDLYDMLDGCEWDADAVCDALEGAYAKGVVMRHSWIARRTLARRIVVEGRDGFGNRSLVKLVLDASEYTDVPGEALRLSLETQKGVACATSNMISSSFNEEDLLDYLYPCEWDADVFADALDQARADGVIHTSDWRGRRTTADMCVVEGRDGFGNIDILKIRISG